MRTTSTPDFRQLISTLLFLFISLVVQAQDFSYVYIQGDKKTPIYVKVEGEMLPRYGKNYALISRLAPGPLNIDILFQQNEYPALHFRILVPENGKRAFLITKKEDAFSLYDLEQNFYLQPNNSIDDDHVPAVLNNKTLAAQQIETITTSVPKEIEKTTPVTTAIETKSADTIIPPVVVVKTEETKTEPAATKEALVTIVDSSKPKFIENIELINNQSASKTVEQKDIPVSSVTANATEEKIMDTAAMNNIATAAAIPNSDCQRTVSNIDFQKILNSLSAKKTENEKLGVFLVATNKQQGCYTTAMAEQIALSLESNSARYSVLKTMYPKISDQSNFAQLKTVFSDDEWKEHFLDLLSNKK